MNETPTSDDEAVSVNPDEQEAGKTSEAQNLNQKSGSSGMLAKSDRFLTGGAWLIAISLVLLAGYLGWRVRSVRAAAGSPSISASPASSELQITAPAASSPEETAILPDLTQGSAVNALYRRINIHTVIPTRPREDIITYTVTTGDSVFGIAKDYNLKPETVLWANYDQLKDSPDMLSPGMVLNIPPINGVYYKWQEGDSLEGVAGKFKTTAADIVNYLGNHLDLTHPEVQAGQMVMVPNGKREFVQWVIPTIPRGNAGVNKAVYGPGACSGNYENGAMGSGFFVWPTYQHRLSGNDYWSGHLGIDIAGALGDPVYAADSGVVVFSGWATGGYGNMIMIDHGSGWQTLYGHLSVTAAGCGANVARGQLIGSMGSTGNSTGPHLHFEIRLWGGFVNPWTQLPPP